MPLDPSSPNSATETIHQLPVMALHESPFQPRQTWGTAALAELTSSVRERGVLQPIVVRPHPVKAGEYEIVFGHRRATAARGAPLQTIPAIVRSMTDDEVRIAQAMENLQREDLTPLDEARQYQALLAALKVDQKTLAARVGKSEAHVSQRLRLLTATAEVQAAVAAGEIFAEVAQLIARQPKASQKDWLDKAKTGGGREWDVDAQKNRYFSMTVDQLRLAMKLDSKPLAKAVFDTTDAKLLPKAGACTACPHRSGNSPDHVEGEDPNRCGDAKCYDAKEEAHYTAKKKALQKAKVKIVEDWRAKEDVQDKLRSGQMVDLSKVDPGIDKTRPLAEVLGDQLAGAVALTDFHGGIKTVAMAPGALQKALQAAGIESESTLAKKAAAKAAESDDDGGGKTTRANSINKDWNQSRKFEDKVRDALCAAILAGGPQPGDLADAVLVMFQAAQALGDDLKKMVGGKDVLDGHAGSFKKLDALPAPTLARALMQLVVWQHIEYDGVEGNEDLARLAKRYAIDVDAIRETVYGKPAEAKVAKAAKKAKGKK